MKFIMLLIFLAFVYAVVDSWPHCPIEVVVVDGKKEMREVCK